MSWIQRTEYLDWLIQWREQRVIKVVSGVRRCGKSTLFKIYRDYLKTQGVQDHQIIDINFEDLEFESMTDYKRLYAYISERLLPNQMNYVFLDEVQHVEHYEKVVDSLFIKDNVDVHITGSNAFFMSGELATLLSGRYIELQMLPLSFKEFSEARANRGKPQATLFNEYLTRGSFPLVAEMDFDEQQAKEYVRNLYNTILLKDVVQRLNMRDVTTLENVSKFLLHNIGSKVSLRKIADTLTSSGQKVDQKTVGRYLKGLTDSLVLYHAPRYNIKGKRLLTTQGKYYVVDIALRNALVKGTDSDIGHILENIVYLELLRRGYDVYVGDVEDGEVDFVAVKARETLYFQVAATTLDDATLKRELAPFRRLNDNYPKTILTLDELFGEADYEGVQKRNILDWLMQK